MSATYEPVTLSRDVIGILIPQGTKVELPEGANGAITQALGGSFTVQVEGHLFRIDGKDADAIGKEVQKGPDVPADASDADLEEAIWTQLHSCYDPEIPVDIVELGLIYRCELSRREDNQVDVAIDMTLTAPGCGMGDFLVNDVRSKVQALPVVGDVTVNLVFDPPWRQDMMSESAQLAVGFF